MLLIRPHQMHVFERELCERHVDGLLEQIQAELPDHVGAVGVPAARALVADGLERAVGHGFTSLAGAAVFVKLLFALGEQFDSDPALPCAAILEEKEGDELARIGRLLDALTRHAHALSAPREGRDAGI